MDAGSTRVKAHGDARLRIREQDKTKKTPLEEFAEKLRECLDVLGVTNAELARRTNSSPGRIGNYTRAQDTPTPQIVFAIEDALELAPGTFSRIWGYSRSDNGDGTVPGVVEALLADPRLKDEHKRALLGIYRGLIASTEG